jgi:glycine/D-amino acid oxidase-like deaminating enzyme/glycine cleavage system aminomethyltransferase T
MHRALRALRRAHARRLSSVPQHAQCVVIGGGIIGTSTAYHLAKRGWTDVILLERHALTAGTTWHAAGLMVTFGSLSSTSTEWRKYSKSLYQSLEAETGQSTGFMGCGFIELATERDRLEEYRRVAAFNRKEGVDVQEISARDVASLFPLCKTDDVLAGFYVADDGRVNPVDATQALAKGFKQLGGTIVEGVDCADIITEDNAVVGLQTSAGTIKTDYVVNCGGLWARELGRKHGVLIPNQAAEHYYLLTDAMDNVDPSWPVVEDPSSYAYIRPEGGGLMVGLFEAEAAAFDAPIPAFGEIAPDWDRLAPYLEKAMSRVPSVQDVGVKKLFCGPESFTPDLAPLVGEAPELQRYFVAAGLNSIGILTGPGVGRSVANWVVDGVPDVDVCGVHVDRSRDYQATPEYRLDRVKEALGDVYKCHYPYKTPLRGRGAMLSPLHAALVERKASFRSVSGFEAADYFGGKDGPLTWTEPPFFAAWGEEHRAVREACGLIDMSFMTKLVITGRDASAVLQRLSTSDIDTGKMTYTQWLNKKTGCIEADVTVCRLPRGTPWAPTDDSFFVVATDTIHRRVQAMVRREVRAGEVCGVVDMTGGLAKIDVQGPSSKDVLPELGEVPFRGVSTISIGKCASVVAARLTYVGEHGYELFVPSEHAVDVHDALVDRGKDVGLRHVGLKAVNSLRLEKGYRDFGHDIDNLDGVHDVGLSFTCDLTKDFNGKAHVLEAASQPRSRRLVSVFIGDRDAWPQPGAPVLRDGAVVGDLRSVTFGHTLQGFVGLAMVDGAVKEGAFAVDVGGRTYRAEASLRGFYDPKSQRVRG